MNVSFAYWKLFWKRRKNIHKWHEHYQPLLRTRVNGFFMYYLLSIHLFLNPHSLIHLLIYTLTEYLADSSLKIFSSLPCCFSRALLRVYPEFQSVFSCREKLPQYKYRVHAVLQLILSVSPILCSLWKKPRFYSWIPNSGLRLAAYIRKK